jgi:hypothetical protein
MGLRVNPGSSLMVAALYLDRRRRIDANGVSMSSGVESASPYTGGCPTPAELAKPC